MNDRLMMKSRLIELIKQGDKKFTDKYTGKVISNIEIEEVYDFIGDYLLANGVIVPPCKVVDTVYAASNNKVYKTKVFSMVAETEDKKWVYILKCNIFDGISMFRKFLFGKTVFLTKEEAEVALKGGEG